MKKLKKILLINWLYFSKELIEVGDVNFLTGKNGAGKSTVIDALQIVLLGETNARNFNQAANEKSQRTLDGYLRADMDENNPYSRRGKDFSSYIACEFQDEVEGTSFVTGVVFDCRSDGSRQERFFIYVGTLPGNCFIVDGEAMEIPALRRYLKQNYAKAEIYDTQKEYRRNMLSRWNVHNEQVLRMMKKAVSFRPIVDIQKFITENICDIPDKPDIEAMQQNIRDYKRHELLAQRQEEKLAALQEIGRLYREMHQAIDRWQVQSFLVLWAQKEIKQSQIHRLELEKAECTANLTATEDRIREIATQITQKEDRRRELELACAQSSVFQEEEKLRGRKQALLDEWEQLHREMRSLAQEIKKEALRLNNLCSAILEQEAEENLYEITKQVGADVPFCIHDKWARVKGIGEKITPIESDWQFDIVVVKPDFGISTANAFSKWKESRPFHPDVDLVESSIREENMDLLYQTMANSLEPIAFEIEPELEQVKMDMEDAGLVRILMSGSGSSMLGFSVDEEVILSACEQLKEKYNFVQIVHVGG